MKLFYIIIIFQFFFQGGIFQYFFYLIIFQIIFNQESHCKANNNLLIFMANAILFINFIFKCYLHLFS